MALRPWHLKRQYRESFVKVREASQVNPAIVKEARAHISLVREDLKRDSVTFNAEVHALAVILRDYGYEAGQDVAEFLSRECKSLVATRGSGGHHRVHWRAPYSAPQS